MRYKTKDGMVLIPLEDYMAMVRLIRKLSTGIFKGV